MLVYAFMWKLSEREQQFFGKTHREDDQKLLNPNICAKKKRN